jgi:hypothetical protein
MIETLGLDFRDGTSHEADLIIRSIINHSRLMHLELHSINFTLDCEALYILLAPTTVLECLAIDFPVDTLQLCREIRGGIACQSNTQQTSYYHFLI